MANKRVILGEAKRTAGGSSEYGLWVSKPGVDVINTSNQVLTGTENMLFDSGRVETGGMVLKQGSTTIAFSGTSSTADSADVYYNLDGSNGSLGYIPTIMFNRKSGNNLYPFNTFHKWETGDIDPPSGYSAYDSSSSNGYRTDVIAFIEDDKFKLRATRFIRSNGTIDGLQNGTHTFYYAVLGIGAASATAVGP